MKLFIILLLTFQILFSQNQTYRIFFKDKNISEFSPNSEIYNKTLDQFSEKALLRRAVFLGEENIIDIDDVEISSEYINQVEKQGARVIHKLKWNNYLVVEADSVKIETIRNLSFVKDIIPTSSKMMVLDNDKKEAIDWVENVLKIDDFNYGGSLTQISRMNVDKLHKMGFNGDGVHLGILDTGFDLDFAMVNEKSNNLYNYDFVDLDSVVNYQDGDVFNQMSHGTQVLSVIVGKLPGQLQGIAQNCLYSLAKTESMRGETKIEEDNYAAAVEWLEAKGVDIFNSSLGYKKFDTLQDSYTFEDLNGNTTIVSDITNKSTKKGVLFCTSAGNNGPDPSTLASPADADSAISVAALKVGIDSAAAFSSRGPRVNGGVFPNVAAAGFGVISASSSTIGRTQVVSGTSFASPLVAGALAVFKSAFPELNSYQIKQKLFESSNQFENPDDNLGYGLPDFYKMFVNSGIAIAPPSYYDINNKKYVYTFVVQDEENPEVKLYFREMGQSSFQEQIMSKEIEEHSFLGKISLQSQFPIEAYIIASNSKYEKRYPDKGYFIIENQEKITDGVETQKLPLNIDEEKDIAFANNQLNLSRLGGVKSIEIYDIRGERVKFLENFSDNKIDFNGMHLIKGLYFIRINTENGLVDKKIIIE